jgi:hypothetical protein
MEVLQMKEEKRAEVVRESEKGEHEAKLNRKKIYEVLSGWMIAK